MTGHADTPDLYNCNFAAENGLPRTTVYLPRFFFFRFGLSAADDRRQQNRPLTIRTDQSLPLTTGLQVRSLPHGPRRCR